MDSTIYVFIDPRTAVPDDPAERIAWLEQHGPMPAEASIRVTAPLSVWLAAGITPDVDGQVGEIPNTTPEIMRGAYQLPRWKSCDTPEYHARRFLEAHAKEIIRTTGEVPEALGPEAVEACAQAWAECRAEIEREASKNAKEKAEREAEEKRKRDARFESQVERYLSMPDEQLIASDGSVIGPWALQWFTDSFRDDPRLTARIAGIKARAAAIVEARDAEKRAYEAAIAELARRDDDLARPVAEGYSVETAVLTKLAHRMVRRVRDESHRDELRPDVHHDREVYATIDNGTWQTPEERAAPSAESFALYDRVCAACREENETLPVALGRWTPSRIVRVDTCTHEGHYHKVTAVLATLRTHGDNLREVTFSLEDQACGHDDPDDDQD